MTQHLGLAVVQLVLVQCEVLDGTNLSTQNLSDLLNGRLGGLVLLEVVVNHLGGWTFETLQTASLQYFFSSSKHFLKVYF